MSQFRAFSVKLGGEKYVLFFIIPFWMFYVMLSYSYIYLDTGAYF